ncbi:MAG TPA: uracil-DNA glycosylase family protein [Telluria sp.]|nr:uracil-DNA glycosylase family protein [Telluria sp.]
MTGRRSAAFLAEMGIGPLWLLRDAAPQDGAAAPAAESHPASAAAPARPGGAPAASTQAPQAQPGEPAPAAPQARVPSAPPAAGADTAWDDGESHAPAVAKDIAEMNWAELRTAIAACTRCTACRSGAKPLPGSGPQQGVRWFVAAGAVSAADEKDRTPLAGDPGRLLTNMLHAAGVARAEEAYVSNLIKCRPTASNGGDRAPTAGEAAACRPFLERELALTGAGVVLTLGQIAANGLLGRALPEPLSALRGTVHTLEAGGRQLPLVPTLHPGELLRRGQDKALAWADLCLARTAEGGQS